MTIDQERREAALQRALDNPMPAELDRAVSDEIVPHCMNAGLKHAEVLTAVHVAYPLIRDYLAADGRQS